MGMAIPEAIGAYFAAKNARDVGAMLACFGAEAEVTDEGEVHRGAAAIGAWMAATTRAYAVSAEPRGVAAEGEWLVVGALVSGSFPGSPVVLRYRFRLAGGLIAALRIG